jgi:hypothetical protein
MLTNFINNLTWALIVPGIALGILLLIAGKILPSGMAAYKFPAQILGVILVIFFTFQSGRFNMNEELLKKNKEQEIELAILYADSSKVTTEIQTEFIVEKKVIEKWREVKIPEYIPVAADNVCKIDELAPNYRALVDAAAQGKPIPAPK